MKKIKLNGKRAFGKNEFALVDDEDYEELIKYKWNAHKRCNLIYADTTIYEDGRPRTLTMSRLILNPPKNKLVDHKDHNTLDNRKSNLRICTKLENNRNVLNDRDSFSKYKGVDFRRTKPDPKKWRARISFNNKSIEIGTYLTEIEAAKAYDFKAKELFGEYAHLNFLLKGDTK